MQGVDNNFTIGVLTKAVPEEERPGFLVELYPYLNHRARKAVKTHWERGECSPELLRERFEAIKAIVNEELARYAAFGNKVRNSYANQLLVYVMYWQHVHTKQMRLTALGAHFTPALKHPEVLYSVRRVELLMFRNGAFGALVENIALHVEVAGYGGNCAKRLEVLNFKTLHHGVGG